MSEIKGFSGIGIVGGDRNSHSDGFRPHVGQKIEGVVVSVDDEGLATISAAGRTITAQAAKGSLFVGEHIMLEITETKGETVLASRVNTVESALLSRLGMNLNEDSLALVSELLKNNQPIDKDILSRLQSNNKEVRIFLQQLESGESDIDIDLDIPLRTTLVKFIANSSQGGAGSANQTVKDMPQPEQSTAAQSSAASATVAPLTPGIAQSDISALAAASLKGYTPTAGAGDVFPQGAAATGIGADSLIETASAAQPDDTTAPSTTASAAQNVRSDASAASDAYGNSGAPNVAQTADSITAHSSSTAPAASADPKTAALSLLETAPPEIASSPFSADRDAQIAPASKDLTAIKEAAKTLLNTFGARENIALVSNDRTLSLRNIAAANISTADLADELLSVAKLAQPNENNLESIAEFVKNSKNPAELFRAVGGERASAYLESSRIIQKQENPLIYYIPIPIMLEREEARADVYYRRKPMKGSDLNVLIALKTYNLGEVRCLVSKFKGSYVLGFALENDAAASVIRENLPTLRRELKSLPVSDILIRTRKEVDDEFFAVQDRRSDFDVRV